MTRSWYRTEPISWAYQPNARLNTARPNWLSQHLTEYCQDKPAQSAQDSTSVREAQFMTRSWDRTAPCRRLNYQPKALLNNARPNRPIQRQTLLNVHEAQLMYDERNVVHLLALTNALDYTYRWATAAHRLGQ